MTLFDRGTRVTVHTRVALTTSREPFVTCKHTTVGPQELLVVVEEVNNSK